MLKRSSGSGKAITRGKFMKNLLADDEALLNSPVTRAQMESVIETASRQNPDMARYIENLGKGIPPRKGLASILAAANKPFKGAAVYGLFIPRFAGLFRNRFGGVWQRASTGNLWGESPRRFIEDYFNAFAQAWEKSFGSSLEAKRLVRWSEAVKRARGDPERMMRILRKKDKVLAEAIESGALDTFVSAEGLLGSVGLGESFWKRLASPITRRIPKRIVDMVKNVANYPGRAFQNLESYMRLGLFANLRKAGFPPAAAAKEVRDSFLDYTTAGPGNRLARDIWPFAQFTFQSIPQQMRFLGRNPGVAVVLAQMMQSHDDPVMPWVAEQPSVRLWDDEEGNPLYATTLGLPVETLNILPNISDDLRDAGRDVRRGIAGSMHPLLKASYGYVTGRDPFFDSPYGSYAKAPGPLQALGADEYGEAGRMYNELKQTGLIQPVETQFRQIDRLTDERMSPGARLLNTLTGVNLVSNDPDRATLRILQNQLGTDPRANVHLTYHGGSEEVEGLIDQLREARKRLKEKREKREAAQAVAE